MKIIILFAALLMALPAFASHHDEDDGDQPSGAIEKCLKAWGKSPFTSHSKYKTLQTSVKVFGIGKNPVDEEKTSAPSLVLVNAAVNVMGGTTLKLLNPNGWYCFRSNVNVMGGLTIKANCHAHLASAHDGQTIIGNGEKSVTIMGSTKVQLVGCGEDSGRDSDGNKGHVD